MIFAGSRYANHTVAFSADGTLTVLRKVSRGSREFPFRYYTAVESDRLHGLGYRFLGKDEDWWRVADANPEVLDPFTLTSRPGGQLRVPSVGGRE